MAAATTLVSPEVKKPTTVLRGFILRFQLQGGIAFPVDKELHRLTVEFAAIALCSPVNLSDYECVTVVAEVDESGKPLKVVAMNARVVRYDYPIWRFMDDEAGRVLIERSRASLDDAGMRGGEVFVHVADHEDKSSRCPRWKKFLRSVGAEKASRWKVRV